MPAEKNTNENSSSRPTTESIITQAYTNSRQNTQSSDTVTSAAALPAAASVITECRTLTPEESGWKAMARNPGLDYTADVIRGEPLKPNNQTAAHNLMERMYWQHEENPDKSIHITDKGELAGYDDMPPGERSKR